MTVQAIQKYRKRSLRYLPQGPGVYALCDLDEVPMYLTTADNTFICTSGVTC